MGDQGGKNGTLWPKGNTRRLLGETAAREHLESSQRGGKSITREASGCRDPAEPAGGKTTGFRERGWILYNIKKSETLTEDKEERNKRIKKNLVRWRGPMTCQVKQSWVGRLCGESRIKDQSGPEKSRRGAIARRRRFRRRLKITARTTSLS